MLPKEAILPFYVKITIYLTGLFVLGLILYNAQRIIVPLIFSILLAILINPLVNFFVRHKVHRVLSIAITLTLGIIFLTFLGILFFSQATRFGESLPKLIEKFSEAVNLALTWVSKYFNISPLKVDDWFDRTKDGLITTSSAGIGKTIASVGGSMVMVFIIPVYIFMILFYKPLLLEFFHRVFGISNRNEVKKVIKQIKSLVQHYLIGLLLEASLVATLYSIGLLILGIENAIILGIIGALLNLIPYLGAIIAASLPMMVALVTKMSPWYAVLVMAMYIFIQFIDNNYIVPKLVASKVKLNALVTIVVVFSFGALWGIPGMFLSIPLTAIVKLIFDHIAYLEPWGFLLGDTMPTKKSNV